MHVKSIPHELRLPAMTNIVSVDTPPIADATSFVLRALVGELCMRFFVGDFGVMVVSCVGCDVDGVVFASPLVCVLFLLLPLLGLLSS